VVASRAGLFGAGLISWLLESLVGDLGHPKKYGRQRNEETDPDEEAGRTVARGARAGWCNAAQAAEFETSEQAKWSGWGVAQEGEG